jgi:ribonuclease HI
VAQPEDNLAEFQARLAELRAKEAPPTEPADFVAHTDGACIGNPGVGGWGTLVEAGERHWDLWGHLARTTNNRAEALAVLGALEWVPAKSRLLLRADSELTLNKLQGRYKVKANSDLWLEINRVRAARDLDLKVEWVRGHAGDVGNERADWLSRVGAADGDIERAERFGRNGSAGGSAAQVPPELVGLVPQGTWEQDFLRSVSQQLRSGRKLSDKQKAIVERMRGRTGG